MRIEAASHRRRHIKYSPTILGWLGAVWTSFAFLAPSCQAYGTQSKSTADASGFNIAELVEGDLAVAILRGLISVGIAGALYWFGARRMTRKHCETPPQFGLRTAAVLAPIAAVAGGFTLTSTEPADLIFGTLCIAILAFLLGFLAGYAYRFFRPER